MRVAPATFCALLASLASPALAINIRDDGKDQDYRNLAKQAQFDSVGLFDFSGNGGSNGRGTGTFIGYGAGGKAWVVTAAHVASSLDTDSLFRIGDKSWTWLNRVTSGTADLAVVELQGVKRGDIAVASFLGSALSVPADLDKRIQGTLVGFGKSGTGSKPATVDDLNKRAMQNRIDAYGFQTFDKRNGKVVDDLKGYFTDFDDTKARGNQLDKTDWALTDRYLASAQTSSRTQETLEGSGAAGDSGGGLFVKQGDAWRLAGVYADGMLGIEGGGYGRLNHFEALDAENAKFVTKYTGIAAVPEPTAALAVGLGLFGSLARRGRTR